MNALRQQRRRPWQPLIEALEERLVPALPTVIVNSIADDTNAHAYTTLRDAINLVDGGIGATSITFDPAVFATAQTITLNGTALPTLTTSLPIVGPAAGVTVTAAGQSGVFSVAGGVVTTLNNMTLTGGKAAAGAGITNAGTLTLLSVTVSGDTATGSGGGVANTGTLTLINSTVSGNSAAGSGGGLNNTGTLFLTNVTVSNNTAATAGGGLNNAGTATLNNTIVAGNFQGASRSDVQGAVVSTSGFNLIGDGTGLTGLSNGTNGNQVGTSANPINPLLAPLGNYTGATPTQALLPGSPALDAGSNALAVDANGKALTTDQRGQKRVVNTTVDVGAVEAQGFSFTLTAGDNQTTNTGTAFPVALQVNLKETTTNVNLPGAAVTYTGPAAGASIAPNPASATTNAAGNAAASVSANLTPGGPYVVAAATGGLSVSFHLTNKAADTTPPTAAAGPLANVTVPGGTSYSFTVTYADNVAVDVGTLKTGNVTVSGPGGFSATPTFVGVDVNSNGTPRTATYSFTPPGGAWSAAANGTYTIALAGNQVKDTSGNAALAKTLGTFQVAITNTPVRIVDGNLVITGTNGNDNIDVALNARPSGPFFAVRVNSFRTTVATALVPGHIIVLGLDGNDVVTIHGNRSAEVREGNGNDLIVGGLGDDVLIGGGGRDTVIGGGGNDVLVAGTGAHSQLSGGSATDVLIGGGIPSTSPYNDYAMLRLLSQHWQNRDTSDEAALKGTLIAADNDTVSAGAGREWMFGRANDTFLGFNANNGDKQTLLP